MTAPRTPVVFIHGLWLHATSWTPWLELFAQAGYDPVAPGWPGEPDTVEQARQQPDLVANTSIDDITAHYTKIIDALDASPVIIGHSFGGLIAEKLLGQGIGTAAVAIDPAQIKGVLPLPLAQLRAALPALANAANLHKSVTLTNKEFRFGFGNALSEEESAQLYDKWAIPSPARPLFQAAAANFALHSQAAVDTANQNRGPPAAHLRPPRPHRPRRDHPLDPQAVPPLHRRHRAQAVRAPRPLADHRQRLERHRRRGPALAAHPGSLT